MHFPFPFLPRSYPYIFAPLYHNSRFATGSEQFWLLPGFVVKSKDCNPRIPNLGIPAIFANLESRDWHAANPGISGLQNLAEIVFFSRNK